MAGSRRQSEAELSETKFKGNASRKTQSGINSPIGILRSGRRKVACKLQLIID